MNKTLRLWAIRLSATVLVMVLLLVTILLNPTLLYAHKTAHHQFTFLHQQRPDSRWNDLIDEADKTLRSSELYDPAFSIQICLNDGSQYPALVRLVMGDAFARGFHSKIVLYGQANCRQNSDEWHGRKWNLSQLLAHEAVHCLQYNRYGLWRSKPLADIPHWKWEGYAEYVARKNEDQRHLVKNIDRLLQHEQNSDDNWISFQDQTGCPVIYYRYWLMVTYCITVKNMNFDSLLQDPATETAQWTEMMNWYGSRK